MRQSMLLEIFRTTKLAVVDRQYRAKTRLAQTLEAPWLHVWTAASGEQVWNEPEYVFHVESLAVRLQHKPLSRPARLIAAGRLARLFGQRDPRTQGAACLVLA